MPPLNPTFVDCLAKFTALYGSYSAVYGSEKSVNDAMLGIMKDSKKSFTDIADAFGDLTTAIKEDATSYLEEWKDLGSSIKDSVVDAVKDPFGNLMRTVKNQLDKETLEKITQFFDEQGIKGTMLNTSHFVALLFMASIKGIATIKIQRKLLSQLEKQANSVANRIYDTPNVNPPIHPFQDVLFHLDKSKNNFQSVGSQLIRRSSIDFVRYDEGVEELKRAKEDLSDGSFSQAFINQAGLGNFVQIKNEDGQVKRSLTEDLKLYHFLPPVHFGINIIAIKTIRNQLAVYNASLTTVDNTLRTITQNLYLAMDIGRFLGSLVQYLSLEVKSMQDDMQKASTSPTIGPDSLAIQAEVYAQLLANLLLAEKGRTILKRFNEDDVNSVPALKAFRQKIKEIDPSKCSQAASNLDASIAGFVNAYQRRMSGKDSALTVKYAADVLRGAINRQREYLDCFEALLSPLGLGSVDPKLMNAIAGVGAFLSAVQGADLSDLVSKNFSFKSFLLSEVKVQIDCMLKSCSNPGVHGLLTRLLEEVVAQQRILAFSFTLTRNFALQARFASQYENGKFAQSLQQFINAIQRLSC